MDICKNCGCDKSLTNSGDCPICGEASASDSNSLVMTGVDYGAAGAIPPVEIKCRADEFENEVRAIGVTFACEWFGHTMDSDFTKETIATLRERSAESNVS